MRQVQPKHVPCIGVCCLHIAAKMVEEESNVSPTHELIRISQSRFTVSDLSRMEKIISEKLCMDPNVVTALTFLHLYHSAIASLLAESVPGLPTIPEMSWDESDRSIVQIFLIPY
ncbi:hypothetical protein XENOCAPTIV_014801 [Xenoophorus captivus]|uniref:Cyclin N-terminal domain-containing protein n=1 Tax=Xenoophorus captivus TaxID=1517983 RepID=A0ABV0Q551_9TELE